MIPRCTIDFSIQNVSEFRTKNRYGVCKNKFTPSLFPAGKSFNFINVWKSNYIVEQDLLDSSTLYVKPERSNGETDEEELLKGML